jgi:thiol-disulfide isomerase/thioredoxin
MKYLRSNIGFIIALVFLTAMMFVPEFKATVLRGFMKIGLFKPDILMPSSDPSEVQPLLVEAPSVEFKSSAGEKLNIKNTKDKVIFLNFWATWCPPCIAEMPSIQALRNKLKNKEVVVFAMVDADSNLASSLSFMKKNNYDLPVYVQTSAAPESLFNGSLPTTVIINKQGKIVMKHNGVADYDTIEMLTLLNTLSK